MQETTRIRIDNRTGWVRCGRCGHKLCRIIASDFTIKGLELKCHSCKATVNTDTAT